MSKKTELKELSRKHWETEIKNFEPIKVGAVLRIADSLEVLVNKLNYVMDQNARLKVENANLTRKNSALKGTVTRCKNRRG